MPETLKQCRPLDTCAQEESSVSAAGSLLLCADSALPLTSTLSIALCACLYLLMHTDSQRACTIVLHLKTL
jgi:hypothetical protein